ncbi:Uncharacterized protein TCAP_04631 [Tolypocladium capitatum]|uniref:DEUBAD domain-containing protein n=1 Tax=Tolypocladium capitatum TaxID=45235 RepID=A0A2K3QD15_9HYPO|nr:Uncharacterized protein TCAP_04631 [Tolypocladium capitatum]
MPSRETKKKAPVKRSKRDVERLLTSPKSPLATADLRQILSNPLAWSVLERQEKDEILALFPDKQHIIDADTAESRPDFTRLMSDDSFRNDCAAYTENLEAGRYDKEWLDEAWAAHDRRKAGDFDGHLDAKFEDEWDVELPEELKVRRR